MPLAEAAALAGRVGCADHNRGHGGQSPPYILPHDPSADLAALTRLAERCERFSPIVGWETVQGPKSKAQSLKSFADPGPWTLDFGPETGPDCLFLDVTGIGVLFGGEENLAAEVISDAAHLGYEVRVAVADTIGAAWAAAKQEASSDIQVFSTQYSVPSAEPSEIQPTPDSCLLLRNLPIDSLRLPQETVALLAELGIVRIDQLLALPRESLRARFGERLLLRVDQLLGAAQETIVAYRPPPQFTEEWVFEFRRSGATQSSK